MTYDEWSVDRIKAAGRPYIASMQVVMRLLSYPKGRRYVSCMDGTSSLQRREGQDFSNRILKFEKSGHLIFLLQ
jgi:hypothetical protein